MLFLHGPDGWRVERMRNGFTNDFGHTLLDNLGNHVSISPGIVGGTLGKRHLSSGKRATYEDAGLSVLSKFTTERRVY